MDYDEYSNEIYVDHRNNQWLNRIMNDLEDMGVVVLAVHQGNTFAVLLVDERTGSDVLNGDYRIHAFDYGADVEDWETQSVFGLKAKAQQMFSSTVRREIMQEEDQRISAAEKAALVERQKERALREAQREKERIEQAAREQAERDAMGWGLF